MKRTLRVNKNKETKPKKGIIKYILIGVCGVLAVSSVFMTVETATSGAEVSVLHKQEIELSDEQRSLEESLVKTISLDGLEQKSVELGYVKPTTLVYVGSSEPVAKLP